MQVLSVLFVGLVLGLANACAQTWNVAAILRDAGSDRFAFRTAEGLPVDEVSRAHLERCGEVLQRLSEAYGMAVPDLYVTASTLPNASAGMREGRAVIGITTGMLRLAGDRDEYLATVLGHELAHVKARHAAERRDHSAAVTLIGAILGAAIDISQARQGRNTGGAGTLLGGLGANLLAASFSRDQEREADRLGTEAMAKAGYDPAATMGFWRLLAGVHTGNDGFWLSSHPSHAEREAELAARARELEPVFAANRGAREAMAVASTTGPAKITWLSPGSAEARAAWGDKSALGQLALLHFVGGSHVTRDNAKARLYGERAAQGGDAVGKAVYGTLLRDGIAGDADPARGIALLQEAAEGNVPWAHYQLGVAYRSGLGVPIDRERALQHLIAAAPTVIEAQDLLSRMRAESR